MKKTIKQVLAGTMAGIMAFGFLAYASPSADAAVKKPKLSTKKLSVNVGKTKKLTVKGKKVKKTTWTINKKKIASLSKKKKTSVTIKGKKAGKATVTAKVKYAKKNIKLKCTVTVKKAGPVVTKAPATTPAVTTPAVTTPAVTTPAVTTPAPTTPAPVNFALDRTELTVPYNAAIQLKVTPEEEAENVVWSSSNEAVATVVGGKVKGVEAGTATITATLGGSEATCNVTVTKEAFGTVVMDCNFDDGEIAPWSPRAAQTEPTAVIDENGYSGKCLRITDRVSNAQGALLDLSEMVEPSATYKFTAWVRVADDAPVNTAIILSSQTRAVATGDEKYVNIQCIVPQKSYWGCAAEYILEDPKQWHEVTYEVTTPDDVSNFGVYFEAGNCAEQDIFVDESKLQLLSRNTPDYTIPSLYEAYRDIFPYLGVAVDYNQMLGENTMNFVTAQYNSVTMGNSMKPDAILPSKNNEEDFVTVEEATELGYYVSEDYTSQAYNKKSGTVMYPKLRFDNVDLLLARAKETGVKMRFHTLIWHQQMPVYFFKAGFLSSTTGKNVSVEVMDSRVEFYVRTVMEHIMKGEYADVIYAIDVVNEYFHSHDCDDSAKNGNGVTFWEGIYETEDGNSGKMITTPSYVKLAFQCANDVLKKYGKRDEVSLIYNDFNTYGEDTADRMVSMYQWLNADEKICDGAGMQTHLSAGDNYHSVSAFQTAINKFAAAGMEIQITEWDATNQRGLTEAQMAQYWKDIMNAILAAKRSGGNVTSVTIWGLYDATSWRAEYNPLPFKGLFNIKESFTALIEAAEAYGQR